MRPFYFVMIAIGLLLGIAYPWYQRHFSGEEIGRWTVMENRGAIRTQEVRLAQSDFPVRIFVDATPLPGYIPSANRSALTIAVTRDGQPVLSQGLDFVSTNGAVNDRPQQNSGVIRQSAGDLDAALAGQYAFRIVQGNTDGLQLSKIDLVLRRGAKAPDETYTTAGLVIGVLGFYLLMRSRIRRDPAA